MLHQSVLIKATISHICVETMNNNRSTYPQKPAFLPVELSINRSKNPIAVLNISMRKRS